MNDAPFRLFPEAASTVAPRVDALFWFITELTVVLSLLIAGLIVYLGVKYRRGAQVDRTPYRPPFWLEASWLVGPLPVLLLIFFWSADVFFDLRRPPPDAMQMTVVARQWMWKFQHPAGRREIDFLHVPLNRPVKLNMISQDVIHSFFVPAFRVKQDVLPGRYTTLWFQADKLGEYDFFCAEYCGTNHSRMIGRVIVQSPSDYEAWLAGDSSQESPQVAGQRLFERHRCDTCHVAGATPARGPPLAGVFGSTVRLSDGRSVVADESYLRESILRPNAKLVAGFQPLMPAYEGQITEEAALELIAYIKSLRAAEIAKP